MSVVGTVETPGHNQSERTKNPRRARIVILSLTAFLVLTAGLAVLLVVNWPFTEKSVTETLEHRFARKVVIHGFHKTFFPPGCVAERVDFEHRKRRDLPPLISIGTLTIEGSYIGMLPFHQYVPQVRVAGLHVTIPPPSRGGAHDVMPLTDSDSNTPINDLKTENAIVDFMPDDPHKQPFKLFLHKIVLRNVGSRKPLSFEASIQNTVPPGEIRTTGQFGAWDSENPGATTVSGTYSYTAANLDVFGGISGLLSSQGKFTGTLARLESDGDVDVPRFHVADGSQSVHLSSRFHATIDATNGDAFLQDVRAAFLHTSINAKGSVTGQSGKHGKDAILDFSVNDGRIDDFLRMFALSKRPAMTGRVSLHGKAQLPSGQEKFLTRLILDGDFGISGGRFTDGQVQMPINHVSDSARGESRKQEEEDPTTALSNLRGHVTARNGIATLTNVTFSVPGGSARMKGTYNLLSRRVDMKGILYTNGKLSDATSGFKSLFLKVVTPFVKHNKITVIPFTITGTSHDPNFALDFDGKRKL